MRFKILSLFVVIQLISFGLWSTLNHAESLGNQAPELVQVHPAPAELSASATEPETPRLSVHFSTRNMDEKKHFLNSIKKNQIETALKKLPQEHVDSVKNITLNYNKESHRGLGGNSIIILRAVNMGLAETVGVLIHELAHNVDFAYLTAQNKDRKSPFKDGKMPLYESDPSLDFYRISWLSGNKRKRAATNLDFVSGYAMSDPFEDFGETYVYYILHNKDFKVKASGSAALYAKYLFMKNRVFGGLEFDTGDGKIKPNQRPWDVTVLKFDVDRFLNS